MRAGTTLEKAKELACILFSTLLLIKKLNDSLKKWAWIMFQHYIRVSLILTQGIADIIYHIFDSFKAYNEEITEAKRKDAAPQAVWPCRLKIITASCKREPIILGIDFRPQPDFVGQIVKNLKRVVVAVKIEHAVYQSAKVFGRHFDEKDEILSHVTRRSIERIEGVLTESIF